MPVILSFRHALTAATLLLATLARAEETESVFPACFSQETLRPDASDLGVLAQSIQFMRVGFSNKNSPFLIGHGIPQRGWEPVVRDSQADVLRKTGGGWLWFHNPFGAFEGEVMQCSARVRLLALAESGDAGAKRTLETFLPAMRKLLRGDYTDGRRVGAVYYFGNAAEDNLLAPLLKEGRIDRWQELWELSFEPVRRLAAEFPGQVILGADSIEELPAEHPHFQMLDAVQKQGLPVVGEPRFLADKPHLFRFGMMKRWRQDRGGFDRSNPDRFPVPEPLATNAQIRGPRFAFYRASRPQEVESGQISIGHLRAALRDGATPVLDLRALLETTELEATDLERAKPTPTSGGRGPRSQRQASQE